MTQPLMKCFINNIELTETPSGWEDLVLNLRNDSELRGLFKLFDVSLSFYADGYQILKTVYDATGYTGSAEFEARAFNDSANAYLPLYTGIIFMRDLIFFSGAGGEYIKTQITDNGLFAKIRNNRNLSAKIYLGKSKNNVDITPCPYQKIEYFSCTTGSTYGTFVGPGQDRNNTAFRVYDVLKYFIDYMSDGEMDFISTSFDTGGLYSDYLITNGYLLRFVQIGNITQTLFEDNWKEMDFATVFKELNKQFNLGFITGYNGSRPFMKIEARPLLYTNAISARLPDVNKLEQRTASEYLYAKLKVGTEVITDEPTFTSFPANIRFVGFKSEEYVIEGISNLERELDLVNDWISDSNTIELLIEYGGSSAPTSYDDSIFLINATYITATSWGAVKSNWITGASTPVYYNEQLNSNNKTSRWYGAIPNNIGIQLGVVDNRFAAQSNSTATTPQSLTPTVLNPVDASLVLSDPALNYNPAGYYYLVAQSGVATFSSESRYNITHFPGVSCIGHIEIFFDIFNNADTPGVDPPVLTIASTKLIGIAPTCNGVLLTATESINVSAGQKVALRIEMISRSLSGTPYPGYQLTTIVPGTTFKCIATADGGGTYKVFNPADTNLNRSLFEYPLSQDDFDTIETNNTDLIQFNVNRGKDNYGWIEEIKYKPFKNMANFTLISNDRVNS